MTEPALPPTSMLALADSSMVASLTAASGAARSRIESEFFYLTQRIRAGHKFNLTADQTIGVDSNTLLSTEKGPIRP